MNHDLWWLSWTVEKLSPLNPEAVVAAQLNPPEDWLTASQQVHGAYQFTQFFWLCWHARPDLRKRQLDNQQFSVYYLPMHVVIHPDTIAEWSEPPRWSDTRLNSRDWTIRKSVIGQHPLTVEQCQMLHPDTWNANSLMTQAKRSVRHGEVLLPYIAALSVPVVLEYRDRYLKGGVQQGKCWEYLMSIQRETR